MSRTDGRSTADGHAVVPGMIVWDNNLDLCVVVGEHGEPSHGVQWWDMRNAVTGQRSPMQDGTRMGVRFPGMGAARAALVRKYVALMHDGHDFGWNVDEDVPCGACGAEWGGQGDMLHTDDCAYLDAQDRQALDA